MRYDIFTDGSCKGNPGPGGYAFVVTVSNSTEQKIIYEYSGGELKTTNNRMELLSIIKALTYAKNKLLKKDKDAHIRIFSDSEYCVNGINKRWIKKWIGNGWKTSNGGDVVNKDLWEKINSLDKEIDFQIIKVKAHADNIFNNRCDELAKIKCNIK